MDDLAELGHHFREAATETFPTSPLYASFCRTVAEDPDTLDLLRGRRPGQQPSFLLFGAVQYLLLSGVDHPLAGVYANPTQRDGAGPILLDFVRQQRDALAELIATRLVQTNVVRRSVGLRFALGLVGGHAPLHLVEVGASAGIHLHVDRYRYDLGGRSFGPPDARVVIDSEWRADTTPTLGPLPPIASRTGIDLDPVDVADTDQRRWLRALVWPEKRADADLLDHALTATAADPPTMLAGDAVDLCPELARRLPAGETRVVFHAATRMHVPVERRAAFDEAIDSLGADGPLFHVWQEPTTAPHGHTQQVAGGLYRHGRDARRIERIAELDGHGAWIRPVTGGRAEGHSHW